MKRAKTKISKYKQGEKVGTKVVERPVITHRQIRSQFYTRLVIPGSKTPSGKRYEFDPGSQQTVEIKDADYLLTLKREVTAGCCGATDTSISYFTEV